MIKFIEKPNTDEEIFASLNPLVGKWFKEKFGNFCPAQQYALLPIRNRQNLLLSAPTGSGKTLSAFGSILNYLVEIDEKGELENKVYAIYISPLKALAGDIEVNLKRPLEEMEKLAGRKFNINIAMRTGDTSASDKQKMVKKSPHILICTPETLAIVLNSTKFSEHLKMLEFLILDEIHALSNKRGVHLSLSVERLNEISTIKPVRIGLSATVAPLEEVAKFLVGYEDGKLRDCLIADVQFTKKMNLSVLSPVSDLIDTTAEKQRHGLYHLLDDLIQKHKTTVVFTNTRSGTERVIHHLKEKFPTKYLDNIGAHHSSISKEARFRIEERLRNGELKVVVTSTSLELGIDIGYIDLVILLGSPKSVARALQRCLPYDSPILTADGSYLPLGEIVENKLPIEIISYDKERGFIKNKIKTWHKNGTDELIKINLSCEEEILCTKEHPILTKEGWKKSEEITKNDLIAEVRSKVDYNSKNPHLFELLPQDRIFVVNKDNFFQKIIDDYRKERGINSKNFVKEFEMPYSRFIDCRRLNGRKKSIRLDYFLNACKLCNIPESRYLPYLVNLKTKGTNWSEWPLHLTKEIMWLAGIVATDGCIVKSKCGNADYYKIKIFNTSRVMIDKIREIARSFGMKPYESIKDNSFYIEFGSNLLAFLFMSLGIPCKRKSYEIGIDNNVFSLPSELIHAYLEGIFEGDGNLNIPKNTEHGLLRIFTASKKFANGLHLLLSKEGYQNRLSKTKIKPSKLIKKTSNLDLNCIVMCRKEDLRRFFESIPCYGEKAKMGKERTKNFLPYLSAKKDYNKFLDFVKITEISAINEKNDVYNLTLEKEPNNFIVGNIIVHNCGRAGHKLHEISEAKLVITDRDDLVECSVLLKEAMEGKIDRVQIPHNCLDVLAQQIFGMAIEKVWAAHDMLRLIKQSYCYHSLTTEDFYSVVSYLAGEYELNARNIYAKIWYDEKTGQIGKRGRLARVLYMTNVGTIPDESYVNVIAARPAEKRDMVLGSIDEGFLERIKKGDVFVLGGQKYEFLYSKGMNAYVNAAVSRSPTIPSWFSEMLPLSFDLALAIQRFRKLMNEKFTSKKSKDEIIEFIKEYLHLKDQISAKSIYSYFNEQHKYAKIPHMGRILVEYWRDGEKNYVIFHTLFGRRINDALSRVIGYAVGQFGGRDIEMGINDNGFFLASTEKMQIEKALRELNSKNIHDILEEAVAKTEVFKRRFRHCATRGLMILRNYKGRHKSVGKQQVGSHFLLAAAQKASRDFPILREAKREIMEDVMDIQNTKLVLDWMKDGKIKTEIITSEYPSPFALNLIIQGHADLMKIEDKIDFLKRMHQKIVDSIGDKE
ncbi:MAG: DEAD/DEAH box helicase [Nanoarchaeota archaeon]|nr:DEAD/DEAH box helicase [Nanoarchaeota archaeon]